ncbi:MAG: carbohydrate ABC transporter permease [Oscillospiraceae bacterium]|jgi:putative aldouronate transport system permease protein|nr:carbohydrate ABC transporter permease [Oscillospiraceae bacterium]
MKYRTRAYRAFTALNVGFMFLVVVIMAFPYVNVLAKSLNESKDTLLGGITLWPRKPTLENYQALLADKQLLASAVVSVQRVLLGTVTSVATQFLAAYALAQKRLVGKTGILIFFMIPMYFSAGLIPQYILYSQLSLTNSFWVYILPGIFSFFNIVIIRTYMHTLPESLSESAKLDGANHPRILLNITLPMSLPILATITLWQAVGHWNDWTTTLYFVTRPRLFTLQYVLMQIITEADRVRQTIQYALQEGLDLSDQAATTTPEALRAAQVVFTTLPIILVYPFLQKYFIKGVMIGAIKD